MDQGDLTQMPPPDVGAVPWSVDDLRAALPEFISVYGQRPLKDNLGGMAFNHCFAVWFIMATLKPPLVIESGVFQGQGTWLIEQASPKSDIVCLDVSFEPLVWRSKKATYIDRDFSQVDWSRSDLADAIALFDDHQNAHRRLKEMHWAGVRRAIFEDNYPVGEGDAYSLRHMFAGVGHPNMQESRRYRRWKNALHDHLAKRRLETLAYNQTILVPPNPEDRANLLKRMKVYHEMPPAFLPPQHRGWRTPFTGVYAAKPALLEVVPEGFDGAYGYLCYVEID